VVKQSLTVTGVDFAKLEASQNLLADFQVATREGIAETATHGCTKNNVAVVLMPGSVKVEATITPPTGVSAASVESSLGSSSSLGANVVNKVNTVANIKTATTGTVGVTGITPPIMESPATGVEPIVPAETRESEAAEPAPVAATSVADLEWWAAHGSKYPGEGFKEAAEEAEETLEEMKISEKVS